MLILPALIQYLPVLKSPTTPPLIHEQSVLPDQSPLKVKWNDFPHFTFPWHAHGEMEMVFVLQSSGTRFVGDSMEAFTEGDLVLVGSRLPHYWKNNQDYYNENSGLRVQAIVVQFSPDFMEKAIQNYPEMSAIRDLWLRAGRGVHFPFPENEDLGPLLKKLYDLKGFARLLCFLDLLNKMARSPHYRLLASPEYAVQPSLLGEHRLEKVLNFIHLNYTRTLRLEELAAHVGMNPAAFSRYFKQRTGQTLVRYVNEMRVGYACKLLQEGAPSITQVCFDCGFNNLSNFNRFFKNRMGVSPREYLAVFQENGVQSPGKEA